MGSQTNEHTKDFPWSEIEDLDDPSHGFELDKLELPKSSNKSDRKSNPDKSPRTDSEPDGGADLESAAGLESKPTSVMVSRYTAKTMRVLLIVVSVLAILAIIGYFIARMLLPATAVEVTRESVPGSFQSIEPIVTNLGDNGYVHIALMLWFHPEREAQSFLFQSKVKDTVLGFMASSDLKKQFAKNSSAKMQAYLSDELTRLLEQSYPNQVILTEIRLN